MLMNVLVWLVILTGRHWKTDGFVHFARNHFHDEQHTVTMPPLKAQVTTEKCLDCPRTFECVNFIECPLHVEDTGKIECHLPQTQTIGICCSIDKNQTQVKSRVADVVLDDDEMKSINLKRRNKMKEIKSQERDLLGKREAIVSRGTTGYEHYRNFRVPEPSDLEEVISLADKALDLAMATKALKEHKLLTKREVDIFRLQGPLPGLDIECPRAPTCSNRPSPYRTFDGACNNIEIPKWGLKGTPYDRLLPPLYRDDVWEPRVSLKGHVLPSARVISATLFPDLDQPHSKYSQLLMEFGQFLSHDITRAVTTQFANGSGISCCSASGKFEIHPEFRHYACMPILIAQNDPFFKDFSQGCMNFVRSFLAPSIDCSLGPAQQMNKATHFIDASMIYGSDAESANALRSFERGKLRVHTDFGRDLLPFTKHKQDCITMERGSACFTAGDPRVNQIVSLTTLHLLFVREHNRIADILARINPHWNDEIIYLETRRIVIAEIQHVVYNEWLPLLIGEQAMAEFNLRNQPFGYSSDYSSKMNPSILNEFATAAFRLHTLVDGKFAMFEKDDMEELIDISDVMFYPAKLRRRKFYDEMLNTLTSKPMQAFDRSFSEGMTRYMFRSGNPFGVDVAALNIQRGRDHGLRPYNDYRQLIGLERITTWNEFKPEVAKILQKLYATPDDIDLYVGGILEAPESDSVVGRTFRDILAAQFLRLRRGDRYFYEHGPEINPGHFTLAQLNEIKKVSMARIICDNSDKILLVKQTLRAFVLPSDENAYLDCSDPLILEPNLNQWEDI